MTRESHYRAAVLWLVISSAIPAAQLTDQSAFWTSKPPGQWTEAEAVRILTSSPWSKQIVAGIARRQTEDQLREGGVMGQPQGVGNEGIDPKGSGPKVDLNVFSGRGGDDRSQRSLPGIIRLRVRWESALPVRLAELRAHEVEPPTLEGDGYQVAVYNIPGISFKGDPKQLGEPLKKMATLKRVGKKDVQPIRVEAFQRPDGIAVVYLFPFSAELSPKDGQVQFEAQIGRISILQTFDLSQMMFQGKLEL